MKTTAFSNLPREVEEFVRRIGEDLRISRLRRGISQKLQADRMGVSRQTLCRIEQGDPKVAFGTYLLCAFCLNRFAEIRDILRMEDDVYGNLLEKRRRLLQKGAHSIDREPSAPDF